MPGGTQSPLYNTIPQSNTIKTWSATVQQCIKRIPKKNKFWGSREENCQKYSPSLSDSLTLTLCSRCDIPARLQGSAKQRGWQETRLGDALLLGRLHGQTFLLPRPDGDREEEVSCHLINLDISFFYHLLLPGGWRHWSTPSTDGWDSLNQQDDLIRCKIYFIFLIFNND